MKNIKLLFILIGLVILSGLASCSSAEKASAERRNYMMPEKTDLPRNSHYNGSKKKKTYKPKKHKKQKVKKNF